jgi:hypothetical protein
MVVKRFVTKTQSGKTDTAQKTFETWMHLYNTPCEKWLKLGKKHKYEHGCAVRMCNDGKLLLFDTSNRTEGGYCSGLKLDRGKAGLLTLANKLAYLSRVYSFEMS